MEPAADTTSAGEGWRLQARGSDRFFEGCFKRRDNSRESPNRSPQGWACLHVWLCPQSHPTQFRFHSTEQDRFRALPIFSMGFSTQILRGDPRLAGRGHESHLVRRRARASIDRTATPTPRYRLTNARKSPPSPVHKDPREDGRRQRPAAENRGFERTVIFLGGPGFPGVTRA